MAVNIKSCKKNFLAIGLMMGGVVGAGIFSLPYVFVQIGLGRGFFYLIALTALMIITYLMYAEVLLKTPGQHNYVSLSKLYLGNIAEIFSFLFAVITIFLVLFIYLFLAGKFIGLIWPAAPLLLTALPFWLLASISVFFNLKKLVEVEFVTSAAIGIIVFIIFIFSLPNFSAAVFLTYFSGLPGVSFWLPIGPLLFALAGRAAVSELANYSKQNLKTNIIFSFIIIAIIYLLFVIGVIFLTNGLVSEDTVSGLSGFLPYFLLVIIALMGLVAVWHVYVLLGFDLYNILTADLKWPERLAGFSIVFIPLILYLINWQSFFLVVSLVGGVFAALENIFIVLMWLKMKKGELSCWLAYLALAIFMVILVHELAVRLVSLV